MAASNSDSCRGSRGCATHAMETSTQNNDAALGFAQLWESHLARAFACLALCRFHPATPMSLRDSSRVRGGGAAAQWTLRLFVVAVVANERIPQRVVASQSGRLD
ncbi:hypothetical protein [Lacipirellula parvula]|uniref:Uncharacterized protein n=1 Tax=Lacipirellula parvula TaxID=2650471 RepID=A0A5K7XJL2_9BACT|nr:hypothetical protein [Lacipirellula parvula]BBO36302.1 hypothetical protein PLANPX_5914 [Lacipirellula parvula]